MADDEKIGKPWSDLELDAIVSDYFAMLTAEQARARGLNDSKTWGELIRTQNIKPD